MAADSPRSRKRRRGVTVAIRPIADKPARKITKIIDLNGKGFSVLTPYHESRSGFVCKLPVDPTQQQVSVPWNDTIAFGAEDHVKLTYHSDGFAQFSSETPGQIISGRDPVTGQPKGLGLFTHPLSSPIWSGPSVGVTAWGLERFENLDQETGAVIFEPESFYYRGCEETEANSFNVSIYAFPENVVPPTRRKDADYSVDIAFEPISGPLLSVANFRIIHLRDEKVFLGLIVYRIRTNFPPRSGWTLNGPGDYARDKKGHVLMAIYPREESMVLGRSSLSRK